jgi:peptidyl-prolyl cis-trans isomerase B (cyclophilin B)
LDGNHTCFGKIIDGVEVIDFIRGGDAIHSMEIIKETNA